MKENNKNKNRYSPESVKDIGYQDFISSYEARKMFINSLNLMDDTFFAAVMEDVDVCTYVLRIITGIKSLRVISSKAQYQIRNLVSHSVILDIIAEDDKGRVYNIEVQKSDRDHHPKRIRYYQANVDISFLNNGCKYEDSPESYFIFISDFDPFGLGDNYYEIERKISGRDDIISNGVHEIYLNTEVTNNRDITSLLKYFKNSDADSTQFGPLSDKVRFFKKDKKGGMVMCDKVQRLIDESNAEKDRIIAEQQKLLEAQKAEQQKALEAQKAEQQKALEAQKAEQQKALEAQKVKYDKISEINIAQVAEINRLKAQIAALQGN